LSSEAIEKERDPVGLPDFTLPVAIVAQVIASLKVDIAAQSIGNIKVDIAAQSVEQLNVNIAAASVTIPINIAGSSINVPIDIKASSVTIPVSIQSSAVTLNVNIASQSVTLSVNIAGSNINVPVDIKAQSVTLNVNIAGASATVNVNVTNAYINLNFYGQTTGVKTEDIWSAEQGYNKIMGGSALIIGGGGASLITYTVPTGKKLYIAGISITPLEYGTPFFGYLENTTDVITYIHFMNDRSVVILLPVPIPIPGGKTINLWVSNLASDSRHFYATILAWEK